MWGFIFYKINLVILSFSDKGFPEIEEKAEGLIECLLVYHLFIVALIYLLNNLENFVKNIKNVSLRFVHPWLPDVLLSEKEKALGLLHSTQEERESTSFSNSDEEYVDTPLIKSMKYFLIKLSDFMKEFDVFLIFIIFFIILFV